MRMQILFLGPVVPAKGCGLPTTTMVNFILEKRTSPSEDVATRLRSSIPAKFPNFCEVLQDGAFHAVIAMVGMILGDVCST